MIDYWAIGRRIARARKAKGMTQATLSELVEVSPNYMSQVENGHQKPNLPFLGKISVAVDISLSELLDGVYYEKEFTVNDIVEALGRCPPEKVRLICDVIMRIVDDD